MHSEAVSTLVTRGRIFDVGENTEPNGVIVDVNPEKDSASPNVNTPLEDTATATVGHCASFSSDATSQNCTQVSACCISV